MNKLLIICIILSSSTILWGQVNLNFEQDIKIKLETSDLYPYSLNLHIPSTIKGRQVSVNAEYSTFPDEIIEHSGNFYAIYSPNSLEYLKEIKITSNLILYKNDLSTAKEREKPIETESDLSPYLQKEDNLQINSKSIREVASGLKKSNRESSVENIFNFVTEHLEYKIFEYQDRGAKKALRQGKGDCTEYSELMIALCRAIDIPARYVNGYVAGNGDNVRHNWVEVYFKKYGWVAFDPTFADSESGETTFDNMLNIYVYHSFERDDPMTGLKLDETEYEEEKRNVFYSSSRTAFSYPNLSFYFRTTSPIDSSVDKIKKRFNDEKYMETNKLLLDSLINQGFNDGRLYNLRAQIYLEKEQLDLALTDLQTATLYYYQYHGEKEKSFGFVTYYVKRKLYKSAALFLVKILEDKGDLEDYELKKLMEDPMFIPLKEEESYQVVASKIEGMYKDVKKKDRILWLEYFNIPFHHAEEYISPSCKENITSSYFDNWTSRKGLILENKVKKIKSVQTDETTTEHHFSENGKLIYKSIENKDELVRWDSLHYDEEKGNISIISFHHHGGKKFKQSFDFEDDCLSKVTYSSLNKKDDIEMFLDVDRSNADSITTSVLDSLWGYEIKNIYNFDKEGKPLEFIRIQGKDTLNKRWIYNEDSTTVYHNGKELFMKEKGEDGQLLKYKNEYYDISYEYDEKGRCVGLTYFEPNGKKISGKRTYRYNEKGLLDLVTDFKQKKITSKEIIEYEYFD